MWVWILVWTQALGLADSPKGSEDRKLKRQAEPMLLRSLDTEGNRKPLKCFKVCVLERFLPGPMTRLEGKVQVSKLFP